MVIAQAHQELCNMKPYTSCPSAGQHPVENLCASQPEPPELLDLANEVQSEDRQIREDTLARSAILWAYESGRLSAADAFQALVARALFGTLDEFMPTYAAGVRALNDGGADHG